MHYRPNWHALALDVAVGSLILWQIEHRYFGLAAMQAYVGININLRRLLEK